MKIKTDKLDAKIAELSREGLAVLARHVVLSLYGCTFVEDDRGADEEVDALNLKEGEQYIDSEKEWHSGTAVEVAIDLENAGLDPQKLRGIE